MVFGEANRGPKEMKKKWEPTKYKCVKCEDVIFSEWPGQFVACTCGATFVDQTEHYTRMGSLPGKGIVPLEEKEEEK